MYQDLDEIEVNATVDWQEQQKMLKLRFPMNIIQMKATYEIPYGHIERMTNGEEEPGQSWIDLSGIARETGDRYGLSILNDGKYSYDVNIRDIGLTVLRSPIFAHHIPKQPEAGQNYRFQDQGWQEFTYSLFPHVGAWERARTVRQSYEINQPAVALNATYHAGSLPMCASFISVSRPNVIASVLKKSEDSDDLIVRLYETAGQACHAAIQLNGLSRSFTARFGPAEIKTFRVPSDPDKPIIETNLLEDTIREIEAEPIVLSIPLSAEPESPNGGSKPV